jgi:hypothetical protein
MNFDTLTAARYAGEKLDSLLERASRDTTDVVAKNDIPSAVTYFDELSDTVKALQTKMSALQKHLDSLSYEILPTMFGNQSVKSVKIDGVGRVTVNDRWSAKILDRAKAFFWLRGSNNGGLIIETVNAQTLGAFAKAEALAGRSLPSEIFQVGSTPYISITKG